MLALNALSPEIVVCLFVVFFRATPEVYGSSQARGQTRAPAAGLHHSHSNTGSVTPRVRPGTEPASSWILVRFVTAELQVELFSWFIKALNQN